MKRGNIEATETSDLRKSARAQSNIKYYKILIYFNCIIIKYKIFINYKTLIKKNLCVLCAFVALF